MLVDAAFGLIQTSFHKQVDKEKSKQQWTPFPSLESIDKWKKILLF